MEFMCFAGKKNLIFCKHSNSWIFQKKKKKNLQKRAIVRCVFHFDLSEASYSNFNLHVLQRQLLIISSIVEEKKEQSFIHTF